MSDKARAFVEDWVQNNVVATGYEPDGDSTLAKRLAMECWAEADASGISRGSIAEEFDLVDRMAEAIEAANDAEVERLAGKDV